MADLSRTGNLRPYERRLFRRQTRLGINPPGEYERAQRILPVLNRHLQFLDMTLMGRGGGYVGELNALIAGDLRDSGNTRCGLIVIDYAGAMAKRHLAQQELKPRDLRQLVTGVPGAVRIQLAIPLNCPVWLLHQLTGQANARHPAAIIDHTDAAESASFGENLDFAFVLGRPTTEGLITLACTKHRRQGQQPRALLHIDGAMNRVALANTGHERRWAALSGLVRRRGGGRGG